MNRDVFVVTERLVLRRFRDDDAPALAAYRSDPDQARFQSWDTPFPVEASRGLIAAMRDVEPGTPGAWLQIAVETGGRLVGDVGVHVEQADPRLARIGYTLAAEAQGRGLATEAVRAAITLLFTAHGVHRVCADCDARNVRSVALMERLGMRREAHHRRSAWWKGEWTDERVYAVLAEEWPPPESLAWSSHPRPGSGSGPDRSRHAGAEDRDQR